jgi:hypothetical protein
MYLFCVPTNGKKSKRFYFLTLQNFKCMTSPERGTTSECRHTLCVFSDTRAGGLNRGTTRQESCRYQNLVFSLSRTKLFTVHNN